MAATIENLPATATSDHPFVFHEVSWDDYEAMLRIVGDRPIRVIYDQGNMEIMSPTFRHDRFGYLLTRLVDTWCDELNIPVEGGRTTTLKRHDLSKGAEPDECFWLRDHAVWMCGKENLDLAVDPRPDLVVEVDVTSSSLSRLKIFAALGIPEVWRHDGKSLRFLSLQSNGDYQSVESSLNFPQLTVAKVIEFIRQAETMDKTALVRSFRAYVRNEILPPASSEDVPNAPAS